MGGETPETCWAVNKRQDNKLKNFASSWWFIWIKCKTLVPKVKQAPRNRSTTDAMLPITMAIFCTDKRQISISCRVSFPFCLKSDVKPVDKEQSVLLSVMQEPIKTRRWTWRSSTFRDSTPIPYELDDLKIGVQLTAEGARPILFPISLTNLGSNPRKPSNQSC
jgi:hypothetical protein